MARKKSKKTDIDTADGASEQSQKAAVTADKQAVRADKYLRLMTKIGIPLALICILSLWLSRWLGSDGLELLFFITCPLALAIGFAYNIRYVSLAVRRQRDQNKS
ncbi:MAG: hypothetical protein V7707_18540 [Motiliproteus sp.]